MMRYIPKQRKFLVGSQVQSLLEAIIAIERGEWLMIRRKPTHPLVADKLSIATLRGIVSWGAVHRADINPLYQPKETKQQQSTGAGDE